MGTSRNTDIAHSAQLQPVQISAMILTVRNEPVMLDSDLAMLYGVETRVLNQAVKRNIARFPDHYRFQLTDAEKAEVITNCDNPDRIKFGPVAPYVFTERGVAMLSSVLRSPTAVRVSIGIMDAFVAMRRFIASNADMFRRIEAIEHHQLLLSDSMEKHSQQIEEVFRRLDEKDENPKQGIFFNGQVFDAYKFVAELVKSAKTSIVLIDNYVDESVLTLLDKRESGVVATIYTQNISTQLQLDIDRHNAQYPSIAVQTYRHSHDRFLCIDDTVYHIGASIKDLGKKWFAFSVLNDTKPIDLVNKTNGIA